VTFRYQRADGDSEVWLVRQVATANFDSVGLPMRIRGLTTDITQRKAVRRRDFAVHGNWRSEQIAPNRFFSLPQVHDLRQTPTNFETLARDNLKQQHPDWRGAKDYR